MSALQAHEVVVRRGAATLLDRVSVRAEGGELLGLIGPNGAGKSSLLRAIVQLLPYEGEIRLDGTELRTLAPRVRATRLAYLAQGDHAVWPLAVRDFVALGRLPYRPRWRLANPVDSASTQAVDAALTSMNLLPLAERRLDQLSGGERARARLARALAVDTPVLLADEPVAALDPFHQLSVMELLRAQCARGRTVVVVLHDLTLASRFCDRVLLLHHGRVLGCGETRKVLTPANLQRAYQVQSMHGEHEQQSYILPWRCQPADFSPTDFSPTEPSPTEPAHAMR